MSTPTLDQRTPRDGAAPAAATRTGPVAGARRLGTMLVRSRPWLILLLILALATYMSVTQTAAFFSAPNFRAILLNAAVFGILVVGMMILFIGGVFDLSIGSTLGLSGVIAAITITELGQPTVVAVLAGLAVGALAGLINGVIVTRTGINALIVTLATLGIYRGMTQLVSGTGVGFIDADFARLGQSVWLGVQSPFWIMLVVVAVGWFAVARTRYFRQFYYVGGNAMAARLSGIRNERVLLSGFVLMGLLAGLAGVVNVARLNAATPSMGAGVELQIVTAAVLGGASLTGGEGTVIGGVLGVFFIALVQNALIILGVDVFWQNIVVGLALLFAVSLDRAKQVTER